MKGVIYARYSSDSQREESIEGQIRENRAYAERNGIEIVGTYIDRAYSARTDRRPDFQRMIKDSAKKKFDVVIVWKLDRFARNRYDSAKYKAALKKNGVKVISAMEPISSDPSGILLESVLEGNAEYYSAQLAENVTRGLRENVLQYKSTGGTLTMGYVVDEQKHFQIDPLIAPIVLEIFTMYADGISMKEISEQMKIRGVRTHRGGAVNIDCITRMLHNRRYIGEYKFRDIVHPDGIPAIVPQELFDRVQERLAVTKKAPAKHKAEDEYLLTTKLYCGECERVMVGESGHSMTGATYRYYKCVGVKQRKGCKKKTVKKEWIEDLVITYIRKIIMDDKALENLADCIMEEQKKENTVLPVLKKQLREVQKGIENMLTAIQMGIITPSTKERLEELEQQKSYLSVEITKEELSHPKLERDEILFWLKRFRELDTTKLSHRRRLIDSFVNSIILYDDRMIFTGNYKDSTKTITFAEIEAAGLSSDLTASLGPTKSSEIVRFQSFFCWYAGERTE